VFVYIEYATNLYLLSLDTSEGLSFDIGCGYMFIFQEVRRDDQGATRTYELDTEKDKDAQAIFERMLEVNKVNHIQSINMNKYSDNLFIKVLMFSTPPMLPTQLYAVFPVSLSKTLLQNK